MKDDAAKYGNILQNQNESLAKRFRALFTLRNIITPESIDLIGVVLLQDSSALLKHECAYCMGQMKHQHAIPYLFKAIEDENEHPMVRHECGEAIGAIGQITPEILNLLRTYSTHHVKELSETCELALDRLDWYNDNCKHIKEEESLSPYDTVDPTPSYPNDLPLEQLRSIYLDESRKLFDRYRALFTLRNIGTPEAIAVISEGLFGSSSDSALFKHEVAFVLGQIQSLISVDSLSKKLSEIEENEIVRHECAEALGSIGKTDIILEYLGDASTIVRESCQVALDMADYYNDEQQFEFIK